MYEKRNWRRAVALSITLAATFQLEAITPVHAAATSEDIVSLINKEHILAPGARLNAQVKGDMATVSTFRHVKADDKDLKIDAVLMSRAIMNLDSSINRVIIYFFNNVNLTKYRQISVSTGDVKAFASGQVSKDDLLTSLPLESKQTEDPNAKVENAMQAGETVGVGHRLDSAIVGNEIDVSTDLNASASLRDMKFAALQIAERALSVAPANIKTIKIAFADPSHPATIKNVVLDSKTIQTLNESVQAVFAKVTITAGAGAAATTATVVPGFLKDERQALLERINELAKNGVGIGVIKGIFDGIEKSVAAGTSESDVTKLVGNLSSNLTALEKANKAAKAMQATKTTSSGPRPKIKLPTRRMSRWAIGIEPLQDASILADPITYLGEIEKRLTVADAAKNMRIEDDKRLHDGLQYFIQILATDPSKQSQLVEIERRLARIQQRHPEF